MSKAIPGRSIRESGAASARPPPLKSSTIARSVAEAATIGLSSDCLSAAKTVAATVFEAAAPLFFHRPRRTTASATRRRRLVQVPPLAALRRGSWPHRLTARVTEWPDVISRRICPRGIRQSRRPPAAAEFARRVLFQRRRRGLRASSREAPPRLLREDGTRSSAPLRRRRAK